MNIIANHHNAKAESKMEELGKRSPMSRNIQSYWMRKSCRPSVEHGDDS